MKALKKLMCIVLSLAMVLGMVVIANAADDTNYPEAVAVLKALKVLVGDTNGNLNLKENLTREQAAKLVTYFLVGPDKAEKLPKKDALKDVKATDWSAGYISYCCSQNVINGFDDGNFYPLDNVTGYQFGKMLVCCIGYDMAKEEISGPTWDVRIAALMYANGLMEDLSLDLAADLTREEAAQMCFNALKATVLKYELQGALSPVDNYAIVETIYDDNDLQLGEKLYPALVLKETKENHTWTLAGKAIGTFDNPVVETEEEADKMHALIGFKKLVLNERVINALAYNWKNIEVWSNGPASRPTHNFGNRMKQVANVLNAMAAEAEENTVLFSKELIGLYTPVLFAKAGEEVFVTANALKTPFLNVRTSAQLKSVTDYKLDLEDLIDSNVVAALFQKTQNQGSYNERAKPVDLKEIFGEAAMDLADQLGKLGLSNALKEFGVEGVELTQVKPAIGNIPAVYKFTMPDRMVTGYDFIGEGRNKVTFRLTNMLYEGGEVVSPDSENTLWSKYFKHQLAILVVQTGEFEVPQVRLIAEGMPVTVYANEGEVVRFSIQPIIKTYSNYIIPVQYGKRIASVAEAHDFYKTIGWDKTSDPSHEHSYLQYVLYDISDDTVIHLVGNGQVQSWKK